MRKHIPCLVILCGIKLILLIIILKKGFDPGDEGAILYLSGHTALYPGYLFAHFLKWLFPSNPDILDLRILRLFLELASALLAASAVILAANRKVTGISSWITIICLSFLATYLSPYGKTAGYNELNLFFVLGIVNGFLLVKKTLYDPKKWLLAFFSTTTGILIALDFFCKPISGVLIFFAGNLLLLTGGLSFSLISLAFQALGCTLGCMMFSHILPADIGIADSVRSFFEIVDTMGYSAKNLIQIYLLHDLGLLIVSSLLWLTSIKILDYFKLGKVWHIPFTSLIIFAFDLPFMPSLYAKFLGIIYLFLLFLRMNVLKGSVLLVFIVPVLTGLGSNSGLSGNMMAGICVWSAIIGSRITQDNQADSAGLKHPFYYAIIIFVGFFAFTHIWQAYMNPEPIYSQNRTCPACENMELSQEKCAYYCQIKQALKSETPNPSALLTNYNPGLAYLFKLRSLGCPYLFMDGVSSRHNAGCLNSDSVIPEFLLIYDVLPQEVLLHSRELFKKQGYRHLASVYDPYSGLDFRPQSDTVRIFKKNR
jgi:hypothetical protein